jgi:hypothetical protein
LEGLRGPAKALTDIRGSMGLRAWRGDSALEKLSEGSGDQGAPMMGWEELSVALIKGT